LLCRSANLPVTNDSRYDHLFSCNICLKLRPRNAFANKQLRARRGRGHIESDHRFCLDCGCRNRMYQPGQFLKVDGREEVLCAICRERCRYGRYCTYCRMCEPCVLKQPPLDIPLTLSPSELEEPRCSRCRHKGLVKDLGKPPRKFELEDMLMAMKLSNFEEVNGFIGSPEWFEEDIAHGNF
jgi:hypothetical protein